MGAACCDDGSPAPRRAPRGSLSKDEKKREKMMNKVMKYVRFNTPNKTHKINKEEMDCFNGEDALKTLMNSKFFVKDGADIPKGEREIGKFYTENDCLYFWKMLVAQKAAVRGMKLYKEDKNNEGKQKAIEEEKAASTDSVKNNRAIELNF